MADLLTAYLRDAARKPFAWGTSDPASRASCDCIRFMFDWIELVTGIDPGAEYRGTYDTERGARNILKNAGGPVAFVETHLAPLAPLGVRQTRAPQAGDVGLVRVALRQWRERTIMVPSGAICRRPGLWAVKAKDAMTFADFPVIAAWAIPHG